MSGSTAKDNARWVELNAQTYHTRFYEACHKGAKSIEEILHRAIANGRLSSADVFDRDYQPIPDTDPQEYTTRFDAYTDEVVPGFQEPLLAETEGAFFAELVDENGYSPTHNTQYCQPLTGDYETDLANNRTKRI